MGTSLHAIPPTPLDLLVLCWDSWDLRHLTVCASPSTLCISHWKGGGSLSPEQEFCVLSQKCFRRVNPQHRALSHPLRVLPPACWFPSRLSSPVPSRPPTQRTSLHCGRCLPTSFSLVPPPWENTNCYQPHHLISLQASTSCISAGATRIQASSNSPQALMRCPPSWRSHSYSGSPPISLPYCNKNALSKKQDCPFKNLHVVMALRT